MHSLYQNLRISRIALVLMTVLPVVGFAQTLPLEIRQDATHYNLLSTNGMPISTTRGTPLGSDGRGPTVAQQQAAGLTTLPATADQFQTFVTFGSVAIPSPALRPNLNVNLSYAANAENLDLPRGKVNGQIVLTMPTVRVGAPFVSRNISFLFGAIVPVPDTDEFGVLLSTVNTNIVPNRPVQFPGDYWLGEPYTTTGHTNSGYYWSPHAQSVFAVNPGPLRIVWRRTASSTNASPPTGVGTVVLLGIPYIIYTNQYVVSGSPVKAPRTIYWTEKSFIDTGKPVDVPSALVGAVNVVYNNNFPERVTNEVVVQGQSQIVTSNALQELRTLWFDQSGGLSGGQIHAYNVEGRVFVELLGDAGSNPQTRQHLGFEIVDVVREPHANDVTTDLGEVISAYQGGTPSDADLFPSPVVQLGQTFTFQFNPLASSRPIYYATHETRNQNDLLVHWLEEGLQGLRWPFRFVRYKLIWPLDVTKYSHYVRPNVATESEAKATAVALPTENAPVIDYQDPLDQPRGKLTETFSYYSWLTPQYPVHRALLHFSANGQIRFERVFSWLDQNLKSGFFAGTVATSLSTWNTNTLAFDWPAGLPVPRVVDVSVNVGDRIAAPDGEIGGGQDTNYLAGYILQSKGTSFNPFSYADPFTAGFETANRGAIIPVNAIPGANRLEVWWFRKNQVDQANGFKNSFWPAVIGRYTLLWPSTAPEIVLASNDGSGPLVSLQAKGSIYFQNDKNLPGYNPNEEHGLMQGGQAFALRDDLNITSNTNNEYSSDPFVLLAYTEADDRPAIRPFKVRREKPETAITFNYVKEAGAILQPPMPLPLLETPLAPNVSGQPPKNLNTEIQYWTVNSASNATVGGFANVRLTTAERNYVAAYQGVGLQDQGPPIGKLFWVFPTNAGPSTVNGFLATNRPVSLSAWAGTASTNANRFRFTVNDASQVVSNRQAVLFNISGPTNWTVTITLVDTNSSYVEVQFSTATPLLAQQSTALVLPLPSNATALTGYRLTYQPVSPSITNATLRDFYASFTLQDRQGNVWIYRGPHDANDQPAMVMKYYYKTLPGFFFPTLDLNSQPSVGTVTPYLRATNASGVFAGDPVRGNVIDPQHGDGQPLGIIYRPAWPQSVPVLQMAETLLTPKRGLPAIRGQSSLEIVYQQSQVIGGGTDFESVVLHDPTREKSFALGQPGSATKLSVIPPSVRAQSFQGKTYFPNLPPHLAERFFFDPNRGDFGQLVFKGQFVNADLGDKYVLLNVLGSGDTADLKALCASDDANKAKWDAAIDGLSTVLQYFIENPAQPGSYIPTAPETVGAGQFARVRNDDVAVDSYALTATGPGVGFVTLISGNGRAFTPPGDPVSIQIIKVVNTLYRGEVNITESSNPLNEKLTLQQVNDLAGKTADYNFQWLIASPVDGLPPVVYQNTPRTLLSDGVWTHLRFPLDTDRAASVLASPASRLSQDVTTTVSPVSHIAFNGVTLSQGKFQFTPTAPHGLVTGNRLSIRKSDGTEVFVTVNGLTKATNIVVDVDAGQNNTVALNEIVELNERVTSDRVQSIVFRQFNEPPGNYSQYWLSLELDEALGAVVYLDGNSTLRANTGADDATTTAAPAGLFPLSRVYRLNPSDLASGKVNPDGSRTHTIAVELYSSALPDQFIAFNVRIEAFQSVDVTAQQWLPLDAIRYPDGVRAILGGSADVRSLADNYLIMRYQAKNPAHASYSQGWSQWTTPQLAEGWIKRVLKGINPFNQRITDLFNNSVNTDVSLVSQAGARW